MLARAKMGREGEGVAVVGAVGGGGAGARRSGSVATRVHGVEGAKVHPEHIQAERPLVGGPGHIKVEREEEKEADRLARASVSLVEWRRCALTPECGVRGLWLVPRRPRIRGACSGVSAPARFGQSSGSGVLPKLSVAPSEHSSNHRSAL